MTREKAPGFQFYPGDWLSSSSVRRMTLAERGAYIDLLAYAWRDGGIPEDDAEIARLLQLSLRSWLKLAPRVRARFTIECGRTLQNARQEAERSKQAEWRAKSARGGRKAASQRATKARPTSPQRGRVVDDCLQPKSNTAVCSFQSASAVEEVRTSATPRPPTLTAEWVTRWEARYPGQRFVVKGGEHGDGLKRLESTLGREELLERMDRFLGSSERFLRERRHDLCVFIRQINQFAGTSQSASNRKAYDEAIQR